MDLSALALRLRALSVLRGLHRHPLVRAYLEAFDASIRAPRSLQTVTARCALRALPAGMSPAPYSMRCILTSIR